jgi:hypothetical protein
MGCLVLASLLIVQTLGTIHNAEHGFAEHKHDGKLCAVYGYGEHFTLSDDVPVVAVPVLPQLVEVAPTFALVSQDSGLIAAAFPRAPPLMA